MGLFAILIVAVLLTGGNIVDKSKKQKVEIKKVEVLANKEIIKKKQAVKPKILEPVKEEVKAEPVKEEVKTEPVKEEVKAEPAWDKEEVKAEPVQEEVKAEPVQEEVKAEPVQEEVKAEPVQEETNVEESENNYLKLILYIIAGIAAVFAGTYFFSNRKNSQSTSSIVDNSRNDAKEEVQLETTEVQPVEEEAQPETTEVQPAEEDENSNK